MRREECHSTSIVLDMNVDGHRSIRGRPNKKWIDSVKDGMSKKGERAEKTPDTRLWRQNTCCEWK